MAHCWSLIMSCKHCLHGSELSPMFSFVNSFNTVNMHAYRLCQLAVSIPIHYKFLYILKKVAIHLNTNSCSFYRSFMEVNSSVRVNLFSLFHRCFTAQVYACKLILYILCCNRRCACLKSSVVEKAMTN